MEYGGQLIRTDRDKNTEIKLWRKPVASVLYTIFGMVEKACKGTPINPMIGYKTERKQFICI